MPGEWPTVSLADVAELNPENINLASSTAQTFSYIDISSIDAGVIDWAGLTSFDLRNAPSRARRLVRPGDFLLSNVRPLLGAHALIDDHIHPQPLVASTGFSVIRGSSKLSTRLLRHLAFSSLITNQIRAREVGSSYPAITEKDVGELQIDLPPLPEQRRIAEILDTLDRTIESTHRIIEKLQATRQGLLHDLLTRGLDEHGQLRDPERNPELFKETELGRLPRAWEVRPLQTVADVSAGVTLGKNLQGAGTIELPYLRVANVQDGYLDLPDIKPVRFMATHVERYVLNDGDVLMNEGGDLDKLGRGAVWRGNGQAHLHQNHVFKVRADPQALVPDYLALVGASRVGKRYFMGVGKQTTNLASINSTQLKAFPLPLPSLAEQSRIVARLQGANQFIASEQTRLAKLRALKRGLMDDLLTGRVRVTMTAGGASAKAPVAQQDAPSTIPFDRAPLAPVVNFRAAPGASSVAQADWVAQARTLAARQQPAPYSPEALDRAVAQLAGLSVEPEGILQVPDVLKQAGVRFVLLQHPKGSRTSGAAFWLDDACRAEPVVALSMRYPLVDVFWFNLFHELGHIRHGHAAVLGEVLEPGSYRSDDEVEREANAYAREALIPDAVWQPYLESGNHSSRGLRAFARQIGRHHATVAGRLGHDLRDFRRFGSRELRPAVPTELFERLVLRLGGSV